MPISPHAFIGEVFIRLSCVNDYIEDMATFTALAKFIQPNIYFCNAMVAVLGEIFVQ